MTKFRITVTKEELEDIVEGLNYIYGSLAGSEDHEEYLKNIDKLIDKLDSKLVLLEKKDE